MKRLAILAALALASCGPLSIATLPPPGRIADTTKLDEQGALSIELAYQAANLAIRAANRAGMLSTANRARAADLDSAAYKAVLAARAAYDTGNSASYSAALVNAKSLIGQILELAS